MTVIQEYEVECAVQAEKIHHEAAEQIASDLTWPSTPEFRAETIRRWSARCVRADLKLQEAIKFAKATRIQR